MESLPILSLSCRVRLPMCLTSGDQMGLVIRFGASEIFVVIVANQVVSNFHVLKDTTCSVIIYIQQR